MSKISNERFNEILREEIARERNKQKELNEIFGLGGVLGGFADSIASGDGMIGGAIKQKIAASILKSFGLSDPAAVEVFSQIIQQFTLDDLKTIWKGGAEQCPFATEKIFMGLCQVLGSQVHEKIINATNELPVIGIFSTWLGGGGVLNRATSALTSERLQIEFSDPNTPIGGWMHANVLPPLESRVCEVITDFQNKSMTDIALGREGSTPTTDLGGADSAPDLDIDADSAPDLDIDTDNQNYSFPSS